MIGAIRLPGSGGMRWLGHAATYTAGAVAASTALGWAVGSLGMAVGGHLPLRSAAQQTLFAVAFIVVLTAVDLAGRGHWGLGLRRQTDPRWRNRLGPGLASGLWGMELGFGLTTYRITAFYWAAIVLDLVIGSPAAGAMIMAAYGLTLGIDLAVGQLMLLDGREGHIGMLQHSRRLRRLLAVGLMLWCAVFIAAMIVH